ncbi:uncharacterized protein LOC143781741 [Ranitomeya variabilis]|uniref:uncharacterized protein LOC143781741 n=2 Tax=Ranitomeya variabilis TaxID=490064 RepID=UPI004057C50D
MESGKIQAILDWPVPKNVKEVQCFIGFANFYRHFSRNFSDIVRPITSLTKKEKPFKWSSQAQEAFEVCFTSAPLLIHPDPTLPFIVEVDASDNALGAILSQRTGEKGLLHPCAFFSHRLTSAEKNYDVGDKELLAIVAFKEWRHHLQGAAQQIIVLTDHRNLEFLRSARCLSPRQGGIRFRDRRIYVPEVVRLQILKLVHDSKLAGHRGVQKTQEFLSRFFWWPTCLKDTKDYFLSCETNGQTERTNQTLEQYLRCYVSHLQDDWSPINSPVSAVEERLTAMRQNLEVLKESLTTAQERYKRSADRFRKPAPMFKGRVVPPPQPVVIDGQEQFVVEEIIDSRIRRNRLQYLIRWQGYPPEEDSWEPVENINAQQKISRFHQRFPEKPGPGSS